MIKRYLCRKAPIENTVYAVMNLCMVLAVITILNLSMRGY